MQDLDRQSPKSFLAIGLSGLGPAGELVDLRDLRGDNAIEPDLYLRSKGIDRYLVTLGQAGHQALYGIDGCRSRFGKHCRRKEQEQA